MADLVLYGNRESGHSYKPKLLLALLGVEHEYRPVDLGPRDRRPADFRAVSAYGEVPVLVDRGLALCQSNAILLHLARRFGRFGGRDEASWDLVTQWLFWEANRIGFSVPNLRFTRRWAPETPRGAVEWITARARADLDHLDGRLSGTPFVLGEPTIVDIACCAYLFWLDQVELDVVHWPAVAAWLDRIRALPGWAHPYDLLAG